MGCGCLKKNEIVESTSFLSSIKEVSRSKKFYRFSSIDSPFTSNNTSYKIDITSQDDITEKSINIKQSYKNLEEIITSPGKEKTEITTMNFLSLERSDAINKINSLNVSPKKAGPIITLLQKQNSIRLNKTCK